MNLSFDTKLQIKKALSSGTFPQTSAPWCRHAWVTTTQQSSFSPSQKRYPLSSRGVGELATWACLVHDLGDSTPPDHPTPTDTSHPSSQTKPSTKCRCAQLQPKTQREQMLGGQRQQVLTDSSYALLSTSRNILEGLVVRSCPRLTESEPRGMGPGLHSFISPLSDSDAC